MRPPYAKYLILVIPAFLLALNPVIAGALATEISWTGDRLGILVLSPEDMSTVYMKPGDKLPFRVAIPDYVNVKRVTLYLCGTTYEMKPLEKWGSMIIYGIDVELPPRNDLYTWRVVVETDQGSVSSCKHKTLVIFNTTEPLESEEIEQLIAQLEEGGEACPLLPPANTSPGEAAAGEAQGPGTASSLSSGVVSNTQLAIAIAVAAAGTGIVLARRAREA